MPLFDAYLMVDWSAAATPRSGRDSIWLHHRRNDGPILIENPAKRREATARLRQLLEADLAAQRRTLAGFDFPFGYPAGFADRLGLAPPAWRAVWQHLAAAISDGPDNDNNRFAVAAALNRRIGGAAAPFWGCPPGAAGAHLAPRHHRLDLGLGERRRSDRGTTQPVWKLYGNGSVGSQALMGIPVLEALRRHFGDAMAVWPFETGLAVPHSTVRLVLAEVYPSFLRAPLPPDEVKDAAQLRTLAAYFAALDARGALAPLFAGDPTLSVAAREAVCQEEGWVLGFAERGAPVTLASGDPMC